MAFMDEAKRVANAFSGGFVDKAKSAEVKIDSNATKNRKKAVGSKDKEVVVLPKKTAFDKSDLSKMAGNKRDTSTVRAARLKQEADKAAKRAKMLAK